MICTPCHQGDHDGCPEKARQLDPDLSSIERSCGEHCYCAHQPGTVLRPDRKADPRRGA